MPDYKTIFSNYSSEALLEKRALGDELHDDAHAAIETIFMERKEYIPPRPSKPILVNLPERRGDNWLKVFGGAILLLAAATMAKVITNTWAVLPFALGLGIYFFVKAVRRELKTVDSLQAEKASDEGLTELMMSAAEGNLNRVTELLAFGSKVNDKSLIGTTALMYAAKNNRLPVVRALHAAGADVNAVSDKHSTALSLAEKSGHTEIVEYLKGVGAAL